MVVECELHIWPIKPSTVLQLHFSCSSSGCAETMWLCLWPPAWRIKRSASVDSGDCLWRHPRSGGSQSSVSPPSLFKNKKIVVLIEWRSEKRVCAVVFNHPVQFYDLCELFRTGGQVPDTNYIFMVSLRTFLIWPLCPFLGVFEHI